MSQSDAADTKNHQPPFSDEVRAEVANAIQYTNIKAQWAEQLEAIELACFPSADPADLLSAEEYVKYCARFSQGGFVALHGSRPVGMSLGIRVDFDFSNTQHSMADVCGEDGSNKHDPQGSWYYGTDIAVDPDYRRMGIGQRFYQLRKSLVEDLGLKGIVAGGVIPGYSDHKTSMSADAYITKVSRGKLYDPTLSFQIENGFEALGAIANYIRDPAVDNNACLIVWRNQQL